MVELKHHPGIIKLPRCHKWQQGILRDQPHGIPEPRISGQCWHIVERLSVKVPGPESGVPTNNGRLILEAGESWGDELSSAGEGDG